MPLDQIAGVARDTVRTKSVTRVPTNANFLARLRCPNCNSSEPLVLRPSAALICLCCETEFPVFTNGDACIPWLFSSPETARLEWSARYRGFLKTNETRHNRLNRALADTRSASIARRRIDETLLAHREHRNQIASLLAPGGFDAEDLVPAMTQVLQEMLPRNQGLLSYADNVFRDWAWNNGENDALFDAIDKVLCADQRDGIGSVLTLGAGACRIPYDLHRNYAPTLSVALDINPLLLLIGSRVIRGCPVSLYEFPIAPLDAAAAGVLHQCSAPVAFRDDAESKMEFVLGDATNPPFARHSFDTVVTPWLVDILPQDLCDFIPQVNRLLPKDGVWVNTGSLAFFDDNPCRCYSEAEVITIVENGGFEILAVDHRPVPYLQSPHSAHGRVERIVSFAAKKRIDVEPVSPISFLPDWILDPTKPVPSSTETILTSSSHLLTAQVLAAVDGKRSIKAISKLVAREYDLSMEECVHAIRRILMETGRMRPKSPI
jgi:hypothetical protein